MEALKIKKEESKTVKTIKLILVLFTFTIIVLTIVFGSSETENPNEPPEGTSFSKMTTSQKEYWINEYKNSLSMETMLFQKHLQDNIKGKFKYPEEVEFSSNESMMLSDSRIDNAAIGSCFTNGELVAKNALGVKSKYYWQAYFTITDSLKRVDDISFHER